MSSGELSERDAALLLDILEATRDARGFVVGLDEQTFLDSRLHQNAVIRSLEIVGEAAGKVSAAQKALMSDIAWREMAALRNRLIRGYADVRLDLIWEVVRDHLPVLIAALEMALRDRVEKS